MRQMSTRDYMKLLGEAHGCKMPDVASTYVGCDTETYYYDVHLTDWGVTVRVPMPALSVLLRLHNLHPAFVPELPWEHAEFYIHRYQVRVESVLSYALAAFDGQREDVRRHLVERFGPTLPTARNKASLLWLELLESA